MTRAWKQKLLEVGPWSLDSSGYTREQRKGNAGVYLAILARDSIAMTKHHEEKRLREEGVEFFSQLVVHHPG